MSFGEAVSSVFSNYANGQGRAPRSEYWYFVLFLLVAGFVVGFVGGLFGVLSGMPVIGRIIGGAFNLATIVPSITVAVRRLHDTGRSGWWLLIGLTIVGLIPLIIWYCTPGKPGTNQFGRNPLEPAVETVF